MVQWFSGRSFLSPLKDRQIQFISHTLSGKKITNVSTVVKSNTSGYYTRRRLQSKDIVVFCGVFFLSFHFLLLTAFGIWCFTIPLTQAIRWCFFCCVNIWQGNKRQNTSLPQKPWKWKINYSKKKKNLAKITPVYFPVFKLNVKMK